MRFQYAEPQSLEQAVELLAEHGREARPLAGGTDLLVQLKEGLLKIGYVVNLKRIPGLNQISVDNSELRLGALTTIRQIERSSTVRSRWPVLAEAAHLLGSVQVRNRATLGGNLCNASPAAEMAPSLIALDAEAIIYGPEGRRRIPLETFFVGPGITALQPGEVLVEVSVPAPPAKSVAGYVKHGIRRTMDCGMVSVAALISADKAGDCERVAVVLGAVAPTPLRATEAQTALLGNSLQAETIQEAAERAASEARPITDIRASAEYRREMVRVQTRRLLKSLAGQLDQ